MSPRDADAAAKSILEKRAEDPHFYVLVDNPNDCRATIDAFRRLGCKVRVEKDGARLKVLR